MTHNTLMHEAGKHDKRLSAGQCAYCDDAEAADRLRAIYDRTGLIFGQTLCSCGCHKAETCNCGCCGECPR